MEGVRSFVDQPRKSRVGVGKTASVASLGVKAVKVMNDLLFRSSSDSTPFAC